MTEVTVTEFARNMRRMFDRVERGEELLLIRSRRGIARIIPGLPHRTASEAMVDLYRTLPEEAGKNWLHDSRVQGDIRTQWKKNPWDS